MKRRHLLHPRCLIGGLTVIMTRFTYHIASSAGASIADHQGGGPQDLSRRSVVCAGGGS